MKNSLIILSILFAAISTKAADKDSTVTYNLPDSIKAVQFMADIRIKDFYEKKSCRTGIKTNVVHLYIDNYGKTKRVIFGANSNFENKVIGQNVWLDKKYSYMDFKYEWKANESYKLLIAQASDSAENFSLYSGYIFLPSEKKWKLIGTIKINDRWHTIELPAFFFVKGRKFNTSIQCDSLLVQRRNGSWVNMNYEKLQSPVINLSGHIDSAQQRQIEIKQINDAIALNKTDATKSEQGVYYSIMKEGTGRQVLLTDTVTVFYKGYLFSDNAIFDQTKDKPISFPLNRLIKGWQIGIPLCKVGGKIKLVIPSDIAYSIRTRSAKIPPNSILVFEIEVVDAK
ncbi:MAG: FKBP-type peptidyl-prolyl cis-trans isomerase [Chitinophagaceae bacterium]|nr:FKBP-type peptidyl-prolyl cis-trans isomerase [Chitinophagaceae bacterium]